MSLTLPSASKQGNIQENWIVQLGFFNGDAQGKGDGGWDATLQADGTANLLNEALDDSEAPVDVDDGTVFQVGDFIKVESEIMKILSISTHTLTVERGAMSTTAATHNNNTAIYWNNFTPISLADTTVDSVFYHGAITNTPSVRSSIDLAKSTAKTGNVSLNVVNFQYKGDDFSAELFLGTRKYINRSVKIYSQLNGNSTLANCLQVYQGRLIDISHDDASIKLTLTEQRPWDFISIPLPDSKTTSNNIPIPVSYGAFTKNSATTFASPLFASALTAKTYRPVPFNKTDDAKALYVDGVSSGSNSELAHYEKGVDVFVPFENGVAGTSSTDGADHAKIEPLQIRAFKQRADTYEAITNEGVTVADIGDSINADDTDAATFSVNKVNTNDTDTVIYDFKVVNPSGMKSSYFVRAKESDGDNVTAAEAINTSETGIDVSNASNLIAYDVIRIDNEEMNITSISSNTLTVERGFNGTDAVAHDNGTAVLVDNTINVVGIKYGITITALSGDLSNVKLFISTDGNYYTETKTSTLSTITRSINLTNGTDDIRIKITFTADDTSGTGSLNATFSLYDVFFRTQRMSEEPEDVVFTGNDGLTESWSGGSAAIQYGHEAHRDMLIRYSGYTTTAPENWSALNTDRSLATWKIRWWALEPVELKKVLEQLQYEFGFIFKFRADGTGSYIHVLQTSELSAAQTFKKEDIANLKINNMPFSQLLTKMEINYEKHPAENRYLSSVTSSNSTARTSWSIQAKENISEVDLDMNVGTPNTSGQTDGNTDFYSYYDNLFGDIKKIINCDIVNPAVSYNLETGDIIQFSNTAGEMPVEPFGDNWADYYMITDLQRSPGKIKIQAREVG